MTDMRQDLVGDEDDFATDIRLLQVSGQFGRHRFRGCPAVERPASRCRSAVLRTPPLQAIYRLVNKFDGRLNKYDLKTGSGPFNRPLD